MELYPAVKAVHVACVVLSGLGFGLRGFWMLRSSPRLDEAWVRRLPHGVDTLLLASALTLAHLSSQYPFVHAWLTAKVCGLVAYIGFGALALRRARTYARRAACLALAVLAYAYIVAVALTRSPLVFLA